MKDNKTTAEVIHTKIWQEEPEEDNPFAAAKCFCSGYDVYGDILEKATWFDYLYLLFKLERPQPWQAQLLEKIAISIANPGIRDHSIRAAMVAGVGGSNAGAALMSAIAVGSGKLGGARDVVLFMQWWFECGNDVDAWVKLIKDPPKPVRAEVWGEIEHPPGFDPHGASCATPVRQMLEVFKSISKSNCLAWLQDYQQTLEQTANSPITMSAVVAAAFIDLEFSCEQAEMLFLMLRLPGAGAHAIEQNDMGWRKYPFFGSAVKLTDDPKVNSK